MKKLAKEHDCRLLITDINFVVRYFRYYGMWWQAYREFGGRAPGDRA